MIIYMDLICGGELCSDALPTTSLADGAVMALESKKVKVGGESIDIGANASKEEAEEAVEDEVKTVINIVESHSLKQEKLDKKTYTTLQNSWYVQVKTALEKKQNTALFGSESKIPSCDMKTAEGKEEFKKLETAARGKLTGIAKTEYETWVARFAQFKKNFAGIQKFVKEEVLANFTEYDFYTAAEPATLGSCMIVPARYIGEALAPTFYFFVDGMVGEKS